MSDVSTLLSRTQHHDKDERYMAVMDLRSCLDLPLPAVDLARVQSALIDRLRDASADVQALSAGSFGPLAAALSPLAAAQLAQQLASLAVSESVDLREVFGQALAAVATVPEKEKATAVARSVVPELLLVLEDPGTAFAARAGLLQLLAALLRTSGADFAQLHPRTKERLLAEWHGMDAELRRVAASALGSLAAVADLPLVESLVRDLLADIGKGLNSVLDLQAIAAVCRNAGDRIGAYFAEIVPLLEGACEEDGDRGVEDTVEILELALLALSSLVGNRSDEISPFVERILLLAFRFISYDPFVDRRENSAFAQDGHVEETEFAQDDGWGDEADADWEDGNFEVEVLLEEQDESWKVRLASAEVVSAFLGSGDNSQRLFEQVLVNLVSRLHDPDSKVRREIFRAICKLLWYCTRTQQPPSDAIGNILDPLTRQGMPFFAMKYEETALYLFVKAYSPQLIQKVIELFTEDSITAKQGCVSILFELASIFPIENLAQLTTVSEIIALSIRNSDVEILLSGLKLLIILLEQYGFSLPLSLYEISPSIQIRPLTLPNVEHITDSLCFALRNPNVNIRVLGLISVSSLAMNLWYSPYLPKTRLKMVHMLMESSVALLEVNDIDHPIKSGSIFCSSALIAYHKDIIDGKHSFKACSLFLTRLRNVVTQVPALLAFKLIFSSPCRSHNAALDSFVSQLFEITPTLLSKKDAFLRHCATSLLASLVEAYGLLVPVESLESVRDLLVSQFSSDDLKLAQLIMKYISSMNIATLSKNYFSDKDLIFFHRFLEFLQEESFPESLSSSAVACFTSFFPANLESSAVDYMLKIISDSLRSNISKTSLSVFSNCIVSVAKNISLLMLINVFNYFLSLLCHSRTTKSLALLVTSELIHEDGSFNDSLNHIKDEAVSMLFESSPTEKFSSVVALKNVLSAAPIEFVSVFTENLSNSNGHIGLTYQVLLSTREAILLYASELYQYSSPLISILLSMVETVDDGIRTLVAECLGILADGHSSIISSVQDMALSSSKEARSFAIMFLRFVLLYKSIDSFQQVNLDLSKFFKTLTDSNMDVVRQALLSLNSIINSNVHFLYQYGKMELQESWIPVLFEHTTPKSEMVKKANFGQFTERMDEHLPVRKAAYICLISLLKKCPHLLQFEKLMESIRPGFEDLENEVQLVAYEVLKYVCGIHPEYVVQYLDSYIPALTTGVKRQLKLVNSDHNALEILSQFVQLMLFLEQIPGVSACRQFSVFREQVLKTKALAPLIKEAKSTLLQN